MTTTNLTTVQPRLVTRGLVLAGLVLGAATVASAGQRMTCHTFRGTTDCQIEDDSPPVYRPEPAAPSGGFGFGALGSIFGRQAEEQRIREQLQELNRAPAGSCGLVGTQIICK